MYLGEIVAGDAGERWEIQFKVSLACMIWKGVKTWRARVVSLPPTLISHNSHCVVVMMDTLADESWGRDFVRIVETAVFTVSSQ